MSLLGAMGRNVRLRSLGIDRCAWWSDVDAMATAGRGRRGGYREGKVRDVGGTNGEEFMVPDTLASDLVGALECGRGLTFVTR